MSRQVTIVGAGIGGLTAALALVQRGFDVTVCEQAQVLREIGAGVQLSPNGCRVLASLGLLDELRGCAVQAEGKEIRLWSTGQTWPLFDLGPLSASVYGFPYLMVHRGDLQMLLARALERARPDALLLDARVVGLEEGADRVTAVLHDGRRVTGDVLIGADGVHSQIRSQVVPPMSASFTGCMAWRGLVPADRLPSHLRRQVGSNWVGPGRHVVTYPLRGGQLVNFVGVVERSDWETESWTAKGTRDECARDFEGWHDDVHRLIDNIDAHYRWALVSREPIDRWSNGRVVLLGDACHPMLPFMAQGAVMAIEDGLILARCLAASDDVPEAFARYEALRMERANHCVHAAARNRQIFHDGRLADADEAAAYVASQWSEAKVTERYDWLFAYDAVDCPIDAP